jgi:hypothetical protein
MEEKENQKSTRDFIPESKENIKLGAKVFSEKASDVFNRFLDKVKEAAETAYEKGTEIVENMTLTAQHYIDKYKDRSEMSNLKRIRDEVATQLGNMCYMEYSGRSSFREAFLKNDEFRNLVAQIRELDKQIINIGERLEEEE